MPHPSPALMTSNPFGAPPVRLSGNAATGWLVRESCGLRHGPQVLAVTAADLETAPLDGGLRDLVSGRVLPVQPSRQQPGVVFVAVELAPYQEYRLVPATALEPTAPAAPFPGPVTLRRTGPDTAQVDNGTWRAELFLGEDASPGTFAPGPVRRMGLMDAPWRGGSFLDTREPVRRIVAEVMEEGPLRVVVRYEALIGATHAYRATLTCDTGVDFIRIDEAFEAGSGDQIVWDFSGADLPAEIHALDASAGFTTRSLHYVFDHRHARLACWNQFSQLHDFSDGYVLTFANGHDAVGCVALEGGHWRGNALNFIEAWERRWLPGDPDSRRLMPAEAKADAAPSPERITARPANTFEPHFCLEGWLRRGRRSFALLLAPRSALRPEMWSAQPALAHFEETPDRERYRQQQSLPRRIHTQHGMLPLGHLLGACLEWPQEKPSAQAQSGQPPWEHPWENRHPGSQDIPGRVAILLDFLQARVFGFWEGSGSAYTNPVVSRRLAREDLPDWEWLAAHGHLSDDQLTRGRAWFAFLCLLFASDHYYPGAASMNLGGTDACLEPTMAGMANQNFYTDVFNFPAMAAQVFPAHPEAERWRETFAVMWGRQLEYHMYPQSGVWEESHTYFHHVLLTVLPTLERRRADGVDDGLAAPLFHKLAGSLPALQSPRDAAYGNLRHVVALGDHGVENAVYEPLYGRLAEALAPSTPTLAGQLAWLHHEMGGKGEPDVPPQPIPWANGHLQGLGYFFRGREPRGESLLVLRAGNAWGHHHNDEGSIQFFAAGRAWIVDSAFSCRQQQAERKVRADGHSRWMPRDVQPLNYLWQFNRGWICAHDERAAFPFATAYTPIYMAQTPVLPYVALPEPILHWRSAVQLAPAAYLMVDRTHAAQADMKGCLTTLPAAGTTIPQIVRFHVPTDAPLALDDGPAAAGADSFLRIRGLFGTQAGQRIGTDHPLQGDTLATREVRYDIAGYPLAAFLVMVEDGSEPGLAVETGGDGVLTLRHPAFSARVEPTSSGDIIIHNLQTGEALNMEPPPIPSPC